MFDFDFVTPPKPTENAREKMVSAITKKYPFIKRIDIGKSLCGRPIEALQIGCSNKMTLFTAAFHGMEWLTTLLMFKFLCEIGKVLDAGENKSENYTELSLCLEHRGLMVVPCVNPDGVEIQLKGYETAGKYQQLVKNVSGGNTSSWQANARGVDLNHNFNAGWDELHLREQELGIIGASPTRYGGIYPESELEVKALTTLCESYFFDYVFAFHSQGEEIFWHFGENTPENSQEIANKLAKLSSYNVGMPEQIATGGGFKDWFIQKHKRPGFTIEVGRGKNPLPLSDLCNIYNKIKKMLRFILNLN